VFAPITDLAFGMFFILLLMVVLLMLLIKPPSILLPLDGQSTSKVPQGSVDSLNVDDSPPRVLDYEWSEELKHDNFSSGSAELPVELRRELSGPFMKKLLDRARQSKANTIEVYGYTDPDPVTSVSPNVTDQKLANIGREELTSFEGLSFNSNIELGMARALSVHQSLRRFQGGLSGIEAFRVYSGGPFQKDGSVYFAGDEKLKDPSMRRIELRLTRQVIEKSDSVSTVNESHSKPGRGWMGVKFNQESLTLTKVMDNPISPAKHSGLQAGDAVTGYASVRENLETYDKMHNPSPAEFLAWADSKTTGDIVFLFLRDGKSGEEYGVYLKLSENHWFDE